LKEVLTLGGVPHSAHPLADIEAVVVDDAGFSYVLDGLYRHVLVYDQEGTLQRTIGGPGSGPGELARPQSLGIIGDTVWV
jgi:hypothetical protein